MEPLPAKARSINDLPAELRQVILFDALEHTVQNARDVPLLSLQNVERARYEYVTIPLTLFSLAPCLFLDYIRHTRHKLNIGPFTIKARIHKLLPDGINIYKHIGKVYNVAAECTPVPAIHDNGSIDLAASRTWCGALLTLAVAARPGAASPPPTRASVCGFDVDRATAICRQFSEWVESQPLRAAHSTNGFNIPPAWRRKTDENARRFFRHASVRLQIMPEIHLHLEVPPLHCLFPRLVMDLTHDIWKVAEASHVRIRVWVVTPWAVRKSWMNWFASYGGSTVVWTVVPDTVPLHSLSYVLSNGIKFSTDELPPGMTKHTWLLRLLEEWD